jgi:hypothetical protein
MTDKPRHRILEALGEVRSNIPRKVLNKSMCGRMALDGWYLMTPLVTLFLGPNKTEAIRTLMDLPAEMWELLSNEQKTEGKDHDEET